jgi:pimeloyl-ACP methyl ester carboxylesterase
MIGSSGDSSRRQSLGIDSTSISKRTPATAGSELQTSILSVSYGRKAPGIGPQKILNVRVGIQEPAGLIEGDVLYIHGFADRLDNHAPLFNAWNQMGLRVISFDLPSHGEDSGNYNDLNHFSFQDLANLAAKVEQYTKPEEARPLIIAGWSTGGLIVVRMLQKNWTSGFSRKVSGAILFAPGVSVRKFPWTFGDRLGDVTDNTLTHDPHPPHVSEIKPSSPFWSKLILEFSPRLIGNSVLSQKENYPSNLPTLVFSAGDKDDMYAKAEVVRAWVSDKNTQRATTGAAPIINASCSQSMHEMDNELPEYGGVEVRNSAAEFAHEIVTGSVNNFGSGDNTFGTVCKKP